MQMAEGQSGRIAKVIARRGYCSRRDAERLIQEGRVKLEGKLITDPALNVAFDVEIVIDGQALPSKSSARLWLFHKPKGLITTHYDPQGRPTVFSVLPQDMPRVISIGRLDYNSEGLLLLTNDGELARYMELPATGIVRTYKCRVHGELSKELLAKLSQPVWIDGVRYQFYKVKYQPTSSSNHWLIISLKEGKNREIRRVFEHFNLVVTRLIRTEYGGFKLEDLPPKAVREVPEEQVRRLFEMEK